MTGRRVHEAGAGVVGDVLAVEQRHREIDSRETLERMSQTDAVARAAAEYVPQPCRNR